ncbi:MAG: hypothetical protein HDT39_07340 [Lachnospiraceae bacterium]|nr:hypothetical protein [Lachnospiraceae bacterium]
MREEEIKKELEEEIKERKQTAMERSSEEYKREKERYIEEFVTIIDVMFKKCIDLQKMDGKGKGGIRYIYISYMRSPMEAGSYEYVIRMHDDTYHYDTFEVESRFTAEHRIPSMKEDAEYFNRLIMGKIIRSKKYEVKDFLREYMEEVYVKPMPEQVEDSIERIKELESYGTVKKDESMSIYYGEMTDCYYRKIELYIGV